MLGFHRAAADVDGGNVDLLDAQQVQRNAGPDDIGNGIHRADFVKVNLFDRDAVDLRFGLAQLLQILRWRCS